MASGMGYLIAPVFFPKPVVTVVGMTLHAYDNGGSDLSLSVLRERPAVGAEAVMATVSSSGQSTTDPPSFPANAVGSPTLNSRYYGAYLLVVLPGGVNYKFCGVTIRYQV